MSRLQSEYKGMLSHSDIVQLLHDEIVSLCQKSYGNASCLEIDGIICISIPDTREQQVVKIHKTLKSVFADPKLRNRIQSTEGQVPLFLQGTQGNISVPSNDSEQNLQNDIAALSNLLRDTNAAIDKEQSKETTSKASKRKRTQPQHRLVKESAVVNNELNPDTERMVEDRPFERLHTSCTEDNAIQESLYTLMDNDVKVKEEKVDPDYESAELTQPKIVSVSSIPESENEKFVPKSMVIQKKKVSTFIGSIIEKEIPRVRSSLEKDVTSREGSVANNETYCENAIDTGSEFKAVEVKVEVNTDESDYGGSKQYNDSESENLENPTNWSYNERSSSGETDMGPVTSERGPDADGRSWIEQVKNNVNKYQAALERSSSDKSEGNSAINTAPLSTSLSKPSNLLALLKQPPIFMSREQNSMTLLESSPSHSSRSGSLPRQGGDQVIDRSSLSPPVVKIEVDEDAAVYEMYSHVNKESSANDTLQKESNGGKATQSKLLSRYPALFSHLQQGKQAGTDVQDSSDSLVNRLPFISFQELFSQSAAGTSAPKLSESTTMQLLAQARVNPYPSKEKGNKQKKAWNWKKRQVRPKDADGKVLPINTYKIKSPYTVKNRFLGLSASVRKAISKRGQKEEDKDWEPDVDNDSNEGESSPKPTNRTTRLSCGEKPRINFAELESSDIEMEEENDVTVKMEPKSFQHAFIKSFGKFLSENRLVDDDKSSTPAGLEKSLASFSAGSEQNTSNSDTTSQPAGREKSLALFSASSEQNTNCASNTASQQYKCSLCGLEFNQEYRWNYHLIKVHGMTEEKVQLFR